MHSAYSMRRYCFLPYSHIVSGANTATRTALARGTDICIRTTVSPAPMIVTGRQSVRSGTRVTLPKERDHSSSQTRWRTVHAAAGPRIGFSPKIMNAMNMAAHLRIVSCHSRRDIRARYQVSPVLVIVAGRPGSRSSDNWSLSVCGGDVRMSFLAATEKRRWCASRTPQRPDSASSSSQALECPSTRQ